MKKLVYVLKYKNGRYVKRDDSTGPMSSGGYPFPVDSIDDATKWDTPEGAARYGNISSFRDFEQGCFPLEIHYKEQPLMPFPELWSECNHHCLPSKESQALGALHYLDCTLRKA
jgi:hypothetical protein